ncbi:MAG: hypothetical protein H6843_11140 [Rhodospirillaceae bacterium]|nr:hypothetical protein [Rhodospirillaceae bacterium]
MKRVSLSPYRALLRVGILAAVAATAVGCGEDWYPDNPTGVFVSYSEPRYPCPGGLPPRSLGPCVAPAPAEN